eukprot:CAMPEP_0168316200 /NCGR_PEP_ID=MMETSP0210-20121227/14823_1 /TAXON_ID=40633 /ORGANISM="Condylostoma magnum, Strain COL2" /LENGTH=75 /DNA_ID=CAMNT_0008295759 /DNA_START=1767 /DNA_END=1994 /DNA_ORIENTATION=-
MKFETGTDPYTDATATGYEFILGIGISDTDSGASVAATKPTYDARPDDNDPLNDVDGLKFDNDGEVLNFPGSSSF